MKSIYYILIATVLFSCKKEEKKEENLTNQTKNAEDYYSAPPFYQSAVTDVAASWDGEVILAKNNSKFYYSKDGGNSFEQVTPNIKNYVPFVVNESGIMAWSDKSYSGFYNLNTKQTINSGIAGFYNEYYVGQNDLMYCVQGTNSSTPPIVFYKKLSQNTWDTLTKNGDSLGFYCGQNFNGGISFFNPSKKTLYIHNANNKNINAIVFNDFSMSNITLGQGNKQPIYAYNGFDKLVVGYTKGFALLNTITNTTTYTDWQGDLKGYYENPMSLSISKEGMVYAYLRSYTVQLKNYEISGNQFEEIQVTCPTISNGDWTYLMYPLNPTKIKNGMNSPIKIGNSEAPEISYFHPYSNGFYSLINSSNNKSILIDDKKSSYNYQYLDALYSFVFRDNNALIICGNDSLMYSYDGGMNYQKVKSIFHAPLTYIKKINNTYYGLATKNYKYNLGGTGFSVDKFNIAIYTSSNLKDWTLLPNSYKIELSGKAPEIFTSNGMMTYIYNLTPQGNQTLYCIKSNDFGATWQDFDKLSLFNADLGSSLAHIAYNGANKIQRQNYNSNLEKTNLIQYTTSVQVPVSNQAPIVLDNGQILFVTGQKVLLLK